MRSFLAIVPLAALLLAGCTAPTSTPSPTPTPTPSVIVAPPSALEVATSIATDVHADGVTAITEDNDPNDLIGRPNGYTDAAVIMLTGFDCTELGVNCGATLEVWPSPAAAQTRSEYILGILAGSPAFGSEYHYLDGAYLLRVWGDVLPSDAPTFETALDTAITD